MTNSPATPSISVSANIVQRVWRWLSVLSYRYSDTGAFFRARLILHLCRILISIAGLSLFSALAPLKGTHDTLARGLSLIASLILFVSGFFVVYWLQNGKRARAELTFTLALGLSSALTYFIHGFSDPFILILTSPLMVSGLLFGVGGVIGAVGALSALLIVRALLDTQMLPYQIAFAASVNATTLGLAVSVVSMVAIGAILISFLNARSGDGRQGITGPALDMTIVPLVTTVANYHTYRELYERAAEDLRAQLGYYYIQLFVYDTPSRLLVRSGQSGSLNQSLRQERRIALEDAHSVIAQAGRNIRPQLVSLTADLRDRAEFLIGTRAELALPILYEGNLIGVLDIHSTQAMAFGAGEVVQLEAVGTLLAFALRQLKQADEAIVSQDEQDAMRAEISQLREQLNRVRRETVKSDWQAFLGGQANGELSFLWTGRGVQPTPAASRPMMQEETLTVSTPQLRIENGQQVLSVPIVVSGRALGTMQFYAPKAVRWDERTLVTASAIGQRFVLLVENLRLIEEARAAEGRERLINQVTSQLQAQTSLEALVATAADVFSRSLGAASTKIQIAPEERPPHLTTTVTGTLVTRGLPPDGGQRIGLS